MNYSDEQVQEYDENQEEEVSYSRKELVYMTKIYTKANQLEEAMYFAINFIQQKPELSVDERTLFVTAFKNYITKKRSNYRNLISIEKKLLKEDLENNVQQPNIKIAYLKELRHKVENEIREVIFRMIEILNSTLIPISQTDADNFVFYFKLKADYLRYLVEISGGQDREEAIKEAEDCYNASLQISQQNLPITSMTRLGLCLNYSVFLYEIKLDQTSAIYLAQNTFNEVIEKLSELEKIKAKESILIVQLLKENLLMWSKGFVNEGEEGEGEEVEEEGREIYDLDGYDENFLS